MTPDLRLLDAYCAEVDGTAIDVPATPGHKHVLRICVASDIHPVVQLCRTTDTVTPRRRKTSEPAWHATPKRRCCGQADSRALCCHHGNAVSMGQE